MRAAMISHAAFDENVAEISYVILKIVTGATKTAARIFVCLIVELLVCLLVIPVFSAKYFCSRNARNKQISDIRSDPDVVALIRRGAAGRSTKS